MLGRFVRQYRRAAILKNRVYYRPRNGRNGAKQPKLVGSCKCGNVGFTASGQSTLNFTCHCSICRTASGLSSTTAAGFQAHQVEWHNATEMDAVTPEGSKNTRYFCKSCRSYVGEDAQGPLGLIALPLNVCTEVEEMYKPNHHIFYANRVEDSADRLPKWETIPEGKMIDTQEDEIKTIDFNKYDTYDSATGRFRKDVTPLSPTRAPETEFYHFAEQDTPVNHKTVISPDKIEKRRQQKYIQSPHPYVAPAQTKYDAIIVGGGHNGLTAASYLAKQGMEKVLVLERRHVVGGAAVTEEMIPGFKFSRGSYLAGLLRPKVIKDLQLDKYGLEYLPRDPSSFTPSLVHGPNKGKSLLLGSDEAMNYDSIAQFSVQDADNYPLYEEFLHKIREVVQPILDYPPMNPFDPNNTWRDQLRTTRGMSELVRMGAKNREVLLPFYELFTGPASHILDRWFESEMLKTTLATDAVIGANISPTMNGSAYVLLHHVMGEAAGKPGVWAYVRGGMGAISEAIAASGRENGVEIACNASVKRILYDGDDVSNAKVTGVMLEDGSKIESDTVISGTTPYHTFLELLPGLARDTGLEEQSPLPRDFVSHVRFADYSCQCFKINIATDALPNFECMPSSPDGKAGPQHFGTVHFENFMEEIENAHRESSMGMPATRPVIEMTIPSSLDDTLAPPGKHVVQLFVQYAPYDVNPKLGHWADPAFKEDFVYRCFKIVDEFAPGFSSSVIGYDALSPLDLERTFGMHKGNIHHGALALHQLAHVRPMHGYSSYRSPLKGLYMCSAGTHPGGGVMGAAGRNGASVVLGDKGLSMP